MGISASYPLTYPAVTAGMIALVAAASCIPGVRAARANPAETLRD